MALASCRATALEQRRALPADSLIPDPLFTSSHAITIDAPPDQVWRWIAQMGAGRAGWYSWDAIDNGGASSAAHLRRIQRRSTASDQHGANAEHRRRSLLTCGIVAPVLYVAMTLLVGLWWEGYSVASGVPSELAAIGAPTRLLWMCLGAVYAVLMVAFGWAVWTSAPSRALRIVGAMLIAHTVSGQFWPPMHQRAVLAAGGATLTDTLHLAWAAVTGVFFMLIVGVGAAALGKRFRVYSAATIAIGLACGVVTSTYAPQIQGNLPTPWAGVWERISIATFMGWIAVFATALLRAPHAPATHDRPDASKGRP